MTPLQELLTKLKQVNVSKKDIMLTICIGWFWFWIFYPCNVKICKWRNIRGVTRRDTRECYIREHSNRQGSQSPSCLFQQHSTWECYFWIDSTQHWESQAWNDSFQAVSKSEKDRHSLWGDLSCEYLHLWNCLCGRRRDILKLVSRHFNAFQFSGDLFHLQ